MRMGLGLGLSRGRPGFRIASLFRGGEVGEAWVNARENYFTKSSGGIYEPVTTSGDKIARFTGAVNGINADQDIEASRPEWGEDGELSFAQFDGVDDFLVTPTITPGTDKVQAFAGVRKESDVTSGILIELSNNSTVNNGTIFITAPGDDGSSSYQFRSRGTSIATAETAQSFIAPTTNIVTGIGDISQNVSKIRVDGSLVAEIAVDQGTGNYLAYQLFIGARNGSQFFFNGRIYPLTLVFGPILPASTLDRAEKYMASHTPGVTI